MRRALVLAALLGLVTMGCTSSSTLSTPTQGINLTGTWSGNLTVQGTAVRMTWTLTQADATNVTGPVTLALSSGTVLMNGFLTGTLSGTTLTYTISVGPGGIPTQPTCAGQVAGTMAATIGVASTMTGTSAVTGSNCAPPFPGGTITLTRS
jgi:hypothetical protein